MRVEALVSVFKGSNDNFLADAASYLGAELQRLPRCGWAATWPGRQAGCNCTSDLNRMPLHSFTFHAPCTWVEQVSTGPNKCRFSTSVASWLNSIATLCHDRLVPWLVDVQDVHGVIYHLWFGAAVYGTLWPYLKGGKKKIPLISSPILVGNYFSVLCNSAVPVIYVRNCSPVS